MAVLFKISDDTQISHFCDVQFGTDNKITNFNRFLSYVKKNKTFLLKLFSGLVVIIFILMFVELFENDGKVASDKISTTRMKVQLLFDLFDKFWSNYNEEKKFENLPNYLKSQATILSVECSKQDFKDESIILSKLKNCITK